MTRSRGILPPRRFWTADEDALLRALYPDTPTATVAARVGHSLSSTYQRAYRLGLSKSAAFLASPAACRTNGRQGMGTRFGKGHVPANKGLRRPGWGPGRMKDTQFRKGERRGVAAQHHRPVGSQRLVDGYLYTKVSDTPGVPWTRNWKPTHVLLWEQHHGPVPRGHAIVFKSGDRTDIRLENLERVTRRELMLRNTIHNYPKPIAEAMQLLGALRRKINRKTNEQTNQQASEGARP